MSVIGIWGLGNTAHALGVYLMKQNHEVMFYTRSEDKVRQYGKTIVAEGFIEGSFENWSMTCHKKDFFERCSIIFITAITTAYEQIMDDIAPYLKEHHRILLFSSKLGGSQLCHHQLKKHHKDYVPILETDALFACRWENNIISIRGFKHWTLYSGINQTQTKQWGPLLTDFFPQLEAADHFIQRGLTDFGAVAHATITIINLSKIDRQEPFLFYYEGLSERTVLLLEAVEKEFQSIAQAYETHVIPMKELLNRYYGCDTTTLLTAVTTVPCYQHFLAPPSLDHRYFFEDISSTLVPLKAFADLAHIKVPMIESIITLSNILHRRNFYQEGRTLEKMGLHHFTQADVLKGLRL
jgi:opine dehydrogenase